MLSGAAIQKFLATGITAVVFILLLKTVAGPHLPAGAQKLVSAI